MTHASADHTHEDEHAHEGETHEEAHPGEAHGGERGHETAGAEVMGSDHAHEHTGSLVQDYFNLLTDPAHAMVEVTYMLLGEILIALILLPLIRKYFNYRLAKAHAELDAEHGITHDAVTGEIHKTTDKEA